MNLVERVDSALESANAASTSARALFSAFMLFTAYIAVVLSSTDDQQLLRYSPLTLPFFDVQISLRGFYIFLPWLYLMAHANMLLAFSFLTHKINHLELCIQPLPFAERDQAMKRLHILIFAQYLSNQHQGYLRVLIAAISWWTVALIPLLVLLWIQVDFLPAQEEGIVWWQRAAILIDALLILYFWNGVLQQRRHGAIPQRWELPLWRRFTAGGWVLSFLSIGIVAFSLVFATIPLSAWEKFVNRCGDPSVVDLVADIKSGFLMPVTTSSAVLARLGERSSLDEGDPQRTAVLRKTARTTCAWYLPHVFFDHPESILPVRRYLAIRDTILTAHPLDSETHNRLDGYSKDKFTSVDEAGSDDPLWEKIIGLDLRNRNLRFADFSYSALPKSNFKGAQLQGASFRSAHVPRANLSEVQLQGASLDHARFEDTDLRGSLLSGSDLTAGSLERADLTRATLNSVLLIGSNLKSARLDNARLRFADLREAELQGAALTRSELLGSNLLGSKLHGTDLGHANLTGVDLSDAAVVLTSIEGAVLDYTTLYTARVVLDADALDDVRQLQLARSDSRRHSNRGRQNIRTETAQSQVKELPGTAAVMTAAYAMGQQRKRTDYSASTSPTTNDLRGLTGFPRSADQCIAFPGGEVPCEIENYGDLVPLLARASAFTQKVLCEATTEHDVIALLRIQHKSMYKFATRSVTQGAPLVVRDNYGIERAARLLSVLSVLSDESENCTAREIINGVWQRPSAWSPTYHVANATTTVYKTDTNPSEMTVGMLDKDTDSVVQFVREAIDVISHQDDETLFAPFKEDVARWLPMSRFAGQSDDTLSKKM